MTLGAVSFIILALAAWRGTRFVVQDELFGPVRDKIWGKWPPESTKIGYLLTCYWCSGFWMAVILSLIFVFGGIVGYVIVLILAVSAVIGLLQELIER